MKAFKLEEWVSERGFRKQIEWIESIKPAFHPVPQEPLELPDFIRDYLSRKNIQLYSHQQACIEAIRKSESVIVTTSTASGKTLGYMLPILERLLTHPKETCLLIYPLKALANDQLKQIQ